MPKLDVVIKHSIGQTVALERIKGLLGRLKTEYGNMISELEEQWTGNIGEFSFKSMGMQVEGVISVKVDFVEFNGKIPLAALPFKSTIEKTIVLEANKLLN